jgi:CheY-like chemotaxis protein
MTRLLEKKGHRVVVAADGREALAALEKDSYDLVLMDIQMPEMMAWKRPPGFAKKKKSRADISPSSR